MRCCKKGGKKDLTHEDSIQRRFALGNCCAPVAAGQAEVASEKLIGNPLRIAFVIRVNLTLERLAGLLALADEILSYAAVTAAKRACYPEP